MRFNVCVRESKVRFTGVYKFFSPSFFANREVLQDNCAGYANSFVMDGGNYFNPPPG